MTWTKLSDDFTDRPDLLGCSRSARLLHVEAMVWSNRTLQDGRVPRAALRRMTDADDVEREVQELVDAGVWEETVDGWQLDWSDQDDAETVRVRQRRRAEIQKAYRKRVAAHRAGDHAQCDPRHCRQTVTGNATGNATSHKTDDETPSRPGPTRPGPKGQGLGECAHGVHGGRRVLGVGENASRACGQCDTEDPPAVTTLRRAVEAAS